MKNDEIIEAEKTRLINCGLMTESEDLHTFDCWTKLGYHVIAGETAITKIPIWKILKRGDRDILFRRKASFFSSRQVEKN